MQGIQATVGGVKFHHPYYYFVSKVELLLLLLIGRFVYSQVKRAVKLLPFYKKMIRKSSEADDASCRKRNSDTQKKTTTCAVSVLDHYVARNIFIVQMILTF